MKQKIPIQLETYITDKNIGVMQNYTSLSKLKSVHRWRSRLVKAKISSKKMATETGYHHVSVSKWINFYREPSETAFLAIEKFLYNQGV